MLLTLLLRPLLRKGEDFRHKLAAYGLIGAAGIYVVSGFLSDNLPVEVGGLLIFSGFAMVALGRWPYIAVVGWLAHSFWDVLGFIGISGHALAPWYPPVCLGFDIAFAIMLLAALRRDSRLRPAPQEVPAWPPPEAG
jgi:hypothetical protein